MTTANGRPQRKQLSDQLDRFDALLDGLADGLNDSIADAVRDGTRLALKDAVIEILTDPTLRAKLQLATAPEAPPAPPVAPPRLGFWSRLKAAAARAVGAAGDAIASAVRQTGRVLVSVAETLRHPRQLLQLVRGLKHLLLFGASTGIAVAVVSFFMPHTVSAALSGITGGVAAMAIRASLWTRRAFTVLSLA